MIMDDSPLSHLAKICSSIGLPAEQPIAKLSDTSNQQPSHRRSPINNSLSSINQLRIANGTSSDPSLKHPLKTAARKQHASNNSSVSSTPTPTPSDSSLNNSATHLANVALKHAQNITQSTNSTANTIGAIKNNPSYANSRSNSHFNRQALPYNLNHHQQTNLHLQNYLEQQKLLLQQQQQQQQNAAAASLLSMPPLANPLAMPQLAANPHYNLLAESQHQQIANLLLAYHQQQNQQQSSPSVSFAANQKQTAQLGSVQNQNDLLMAVYQQAFLQSCQQYRPNLTQPIGQPPSNSMAKQSPTSKQVSVTQQSPSASPASSPQTNSASTASLTAQQNPLAATNLSQNNYLDTSSAAAAALAAASSLQTHPPHCLCAGCIYMKSFFRP